MDFLDLIEDLSYAAEAVSASDFKSADKAAKAAIKAANKAMKAGNYDTAIKYCDDGIAAIKTVKARISSEGVDSGVGAGAVKGIVTSVLLALAAAGAITAAQKFGGKVVNNKRVISAQTSMAVAANKGRQKAYDSRTKRGQKMYNDAADAMDKLDKSKYDRVRKGSVVGPVPNDLTKAEKRAQKRNLKKAGRAVNMGGAPLVSEREFSVELGDGSVNTYQRTDRANKATFNTNRRDISADIRANNNAAYNRFAAGGVKTAAKGAAIVGVGAGVVTALKAFIASKNATPESMIAALDASIKSLEAIKASCKEAKKSKVTESYLDMVDFFDGVYEAMFATENASILEDLIECGATDTQAVEAYVNFIVPAISEYDAAVEAGVYDGDADEDYDDDVDYEEADESYDYDDEDYDDDVDYEDSYIDLD